MHRVAVEYEVLTKSGVFNLWFVDDDLEQNYHHGANNLFADLPNAIDHQMLYAQVFGKGNVNDSGHHKQGKTGNCPADHAPHKKVADLLH